MIDTKPPKIVRLNAEKGLKLRRNAPKSRKGGLTTKEAGELHIGSGVARAVSLKNGQSLSKDSISKMVRFFARHEKNKNTPKGRIAWLLWGGDAGRRWSNSLFRQFKEKSCLCKSLEDSMKEKAKVFNKSKYTWYTYSSLKRKKLSDIKGKHSVVFERGTVFGIRPATSKKGMFRLVVPEYGDSIVFSFDTKVADSLISSSKLSKQLKASGEIHKPLSYAMTPEGIAAKHGVSVQNILSSIEDYWQDEAKEHGLNEREAKGVVMDHLVEDPNYYLKLAEVGLE
jgi:hypothetical protein